MEKTLQLGLLENSHRFLCEAAKKARLAEDQPDEWMFAASALVQSVELALKAALADIHPVLIYENIDNPKRSVTIGIAISRLTNKSIGKIEFTIKDKKRLDRAIAIRNEITHSDFSLNFSQVEANFHEVFAFLAEFNRRHLETNIDEIIDAADLVAFLDNRKHHQEMLLRARTRLEDEGIEAHSLRSCSYCTEDTFVEEIDGFRCYLCHHLEPSVQCQNCGESFLEEELEDFSDAFQADYSEGRHDVFYNYGYDFHKACPECVAEIKQHIYELEQQNYFDQMMEDEYQDRVRGN
ncbi:hypothetical protein [Sulfitobacter sp. 20_GPM-1509m]|uniref:hypothetical protein n=1 Tax=Sulfitobacter sp. 20_GPM-1509m TaxID=1380367 RepID=UPI00048DF4C7|nr:hypothetical protein [Sulfitobacter sp. 20_GPM-1509m]